MPLKAAFFKEQIKQRRPIARSRRLRKIWGGRWESNPRQLESQSSALPTELRPPCCGATLQTGYNLTEAWCGRRDSNSYSLRRWNLNLVPELGLFAKPFRYKGLARILHRWDTLCNAKFVSQVSPCVPVCPALIWVGPRSPLRAYSARATNQKMCPN